MKNNDGYMNAKNWQQRLGASARRRSKRKLKDQIEILEAQLAKEKTKTEKYKKRLHRSKKGSLSKSPRSKVNDLLGRNKVNSPIKRALIFHTSLIEDIKRKYENAKPNRDKQLIAKVISGNIQKKYKLQKHAQTAFGYSNKRAKYPVDLTNHGRRCVSRNELRKNVTSFFLRDDVSRMTTGRKQTVTLLKKKMQRRLLTDTRKNLHRKFLSEHIGQVSYTSFCRLRPFWVVTPSSSDRDTCLCKKHENLQFMANALQSQGLLSSRNIEEMSEATMCDPKAKVCAYGECSECLLTCHPMLKIPGEENIRLSQWMTEKITKDEKVSTITVKREITTTQHDLNTDFQERLLHFKRHVFNIKWQFNAYRELRRSLKHNESLLHIDFSENYSCKYSQEIQSVHFGGSHQQANLHTGVLYTAGGQAPHTFCSISPSRRHDPVAIWAHLDPILKVVRERHPQVSILHFFSDGPATQYRQKGNFFYLSTEPYKYGFKEITWNFFEASHGKGAPDGVGGALKRSADRIMAHGGDIPDAQSLYDKLKSLDTSVELFFVPERDIESKAQVPAIAAVKGTLRIHQAISLTPGQMKYRDISCLCKREEGVLDCPCFNLQEVTLADVPVSSDESPASGKAPDNPRRPAMIEVKHIGEWCVVNYDNEAYPGFIMDAEGHSVKLSVCTAMA
ncbi:uncharacterized protein LOC117554075 isoform X2 [Gymnodraco acuticeps]|uniref:Uncharacterized protein LOC117554075 isoform X2 n=1 Tax=Gymnodraco acuticeps TaxID=8218 RepID=A0A6P8W9K8_GYMAC|nr:uncharacterized protein LOC117554075 isoform X2 [Gymnodraco acuticeps]